MVQNGPVHNRCRLTDEQLLAKLAREGPCSGCTTDCPDWTECQKPNSVWYADGVDNAGISIEGDIDRNYLVECCLQLPADWECLFDEHDRFIGFVGGSELTGRF